MQKLERSSTEPNMWPKLQIITKNHENIYEFWKRVWGKWKSKIIEANDDNLILKLLRLESESSLKKVKVKI